MAISTHHALEGRGGEGGEGEGGGRAHTSIAQCSKQGYFEEVEVLQGLLRVGEGKPPSVADN